MKKEGVTFIGCCRKSCTGENDEDRARLLQIGREGHTEHIGRSAFYGALLAFCGEWQRKSCGGYRTVYFTWCPARLPQRMAEKLVRRSLGDRVYISPRSSAGRAMLSRDFDSRFDVSMVQSAVGNTHDMLEYVNITSNVALVVLGYAGLTTDAEHLKQFINMLNIQYVFVDQTPHKHTINMLRRAELLNDDTAINLLDGRNSCEKRSQ
ncbi:hypothetical protein BCR43DRAFT_444695 [Syncephalastrum racemosum]|uniref:Uncharacterized protein n=1 Tax=Syncephalastrum racemosum TaxID=13706 RepID=A0A1X2H576_SYNRA|nr:hypothetical protein BCR43DRAFT_444695 [Syncephalastrum racemosum]